MPFHLLFLPYSCSYLSAGLISLQAEPGLSHNGAFPGSIHGPTYNTSWLLFWSMVPRVVLTSHACHVQACSKSYARILYVPPVPKDCKNVLSSTNMHYVMRSYPSS